MLIQPAGIVIFAVENLTRLSGMKKEVLAVDLHPERAWVIWLASKRRDYLNPRQAMSVTWITDPDLSSGQCIPPNTCVSKELRAKAGILHTLIQDLIVWIGILHSLSLLVLIFDGLYSYFGH